jgi:hypothetical protein
MLDVLLIGLTLSFFLASLGLIAGAGRLMEG